MEVKFTMHRQHSVKRSMSESAAMLVQV